MKDKNHYKKCIKEGIEELIDRAKRMDEANVQSIITWSAWINKDANRLLDELRKSKKR